MAVKSQYAEALLFTLGATIFSIASQKTSSDMDNSSTEPIGIFFCLLYILFNSFTPQWQERRSSCSQYSRTNVDTFQMMLGVSILDTAMTTLGFLASGDFVVVCFFKQIRASLATLSLPAAICRQHTGNILYPLYHTPRVWSSCLDNSHAMDGNGSKVHFC